MSATTFAPANYSKAALKVMLTDDTFKPYHAAIEAYLAPKPSPQSVPTAELKPRDDGKTWSKVGALTAITYSKGYVKLESGRPGNFIGLYEADAKAMIEFLQAGLASGAIKPRQ